MIRIGPHVPTEKTTLKSEMTPNELGQVVKKVISKHPALTRLRKELIKDSAVETVISSYDRMHHRHNRS